MSRTGESYDEIVWRQFRKNRLAYYSLWAFPPMFAVAILAPALASNMPFVFWDGEQWLFPWFFGLFWVDEAVDFGFNMVLAASPVALAMLGWRVARNRAKGLPATRRLRDVLFVYMALVLTLSLVCGYLKVRPNNPYRQRSFPEEQFQSGGARWGIYPPIPFGPTEQDVLARFQPPMWREPAELWKESNDGAPHLLGSDDIGRDVLSRMIHGSRLSLTVGFFAVSIYITIGVFLGALAGYFGGWVDIIISRLIEIVMLFPAFFLILTLVALMGPSIYIIMFVIGIASWPSIARLIRGEVLKQRSLEYVLAARALGVSPIRIIFRHILPNAITPALVAVPFGVAGAITTEAGLSLLGFGVRPPAPSWGSLLKLGQANYHYWWLVLFPSLAIFATVTLFNLVGSGLRDAMDPRLRS